MGPNLEQSFARRSLALAVISRRSVGSLPHPRGSRIVGPSPRSTEAWPRWQGQKYETWKPARHVTLLRMHAKVQLQVSKKFPSRMSISKRLDV